MGAKSRIGSSRSRRILAITIAMVVGALLVVAAVLQSQSTDETPAPEAQPTPEEAICRVDGEFVAGFMSPQADDGQTAELLEHMDTDAITFGGRIVPADVDDYPAQIAEAIGDRQAYEYTVEMNWDGVDLADTDEVVEVDGTEYGIIEAGDNSVVITESFDGGDPFHSLPRVSSQRDHQAFIGLPVPQMRTSGQTWLPDNTYAEVVDGFAEKFVAAYDQRGADGFYLAMEMPLTDADHWNPVTDYYDRQNRIINTVSPGATVVVSPYLEGRKDRETISPDTAAAGYEKLLELQNGTSLLVSPQDGLGVGTTALASDDSAEHSVTVEDYFAALHEVDSERLYVTVEAMRPGGGSADSRKPTDRDRVEAQLEATEPYVQGAIGFQWSGPNAMTEIPHIGSGACAGGHNNLP